MKKFLLRRLGVAHDPGNSKPSLQACIEAVLEQSDAIIDDILQGLQASISPAKGATLHARQNPAAKATIEGLMAQQTLFKKAFATSLRAAVYGGETHRNRVQPQFRFDDFQFMEAEQIDANIELAITEQEIQLAVEEALPPLNALVSSLLGWSTVQPQLNPLKPEAFVFALREALREAVPSGEARAGIMTPAAGLLGANMYQLYRQVTDWLKTHGVEAVGTMSNAAGAFGQAVKVQENSVTKSLLTLDKLRRLLSGELEFGQPAASAVDFSHTVPASFMALEDMKLVEPMMKRLAQRAKQSAPPPVKDPSKPQQVAEKREQAQSKKLGNELGEEVVRLMLENLMHDNRLLAPVRANLKALEPVLLKLSKADARFFSQRQHPARQFLDKITSRSLAFSTVDEPGFARFQKTFENSVSVLSGGEGDSMAFARLLRRLEDAWAVEEQEQRRKAEESARALLEAEQRNLLAEKLAEDFANRVPARKVPEFVAAFLRGPWALVVAQSQLHLEGSGSASQTYLDLVDDLLWSVQVKLARRNLSRLVELVPQMLVTMRQGLRLIDYPEDRIPLFFDALVTVHEKAFEAGRVVKPALEVSDMSVPEGVDEEVVPPTEPEAEPIAEEAAVSAWNPDVEDHASEMLGDSNDIPLDFTEPPEVADPALQAAWSAESLNTGAWVDLALGGVWVRAQLTWASPHRTLFMFISGGGLAHSMSRRTMDRLRGMGLIRLVSDGHVMDNALDAVARTALRNDVQKAGGAH